MAYVFKNQKGGATAKVRNADTSDYGINLKGINGTQENADNFRTAIGGLIDIAGKTIPNGEAALIRTLNQDVVTTEEGESPEFSLERNSANASDLNDGYITITTSNTTGRAGTLSYSGKKPKGIKTMNYNAEGDLFIQFESGTHFTTGTYNADMIITLNAQTVDGIKYRSESATFTWTNGVASEFEDF